MRELFRSQHFRLLFGGQVTTMVGDSLLLVVLAVWMKELTGSSAKAGATMLAVSAPALLSPLFGWGVDQFKRRPFLIWTNIVSAGALVPLFAVRRADDAWVIYIVALVYGLSLVMNSAGLAGLLKGVVVHARLAEANGALRTVREGLRLVGPITGVGLYALAGGSAVVVASMTAFLLAATLLFSLRLTEEPPRSTALHWRTEAGAGFRHLASVPALRHAAIAVGVSFLMFGTIQAGVFAYVDAALHRPATFVGVLVTAMGVGSVAGGLLSPWLIRRIGEHRVIVAGLAMMAIGLGLLVYPHITVGLIAAPLVGAGVAAVAVAFSTLMQRRTPAPIIGRVSTATDLLIVAPQTLSIAAGAALVAIVSYQWIFAVAATGLICAAGALWAVREHVTGSPAVPVSESAST